MFKKFVICSRIDILVTVIVAKYYDERSFCVKGGVGILMIVDRLVYRIISMYISFELGLVMVLVWCGTIG